MKDGEQIAKDSVNGYTVSTIYLNDCLGYETMIFNYKPNFASHLQWRYKNASEATEGHFKALDMAKSGNIDERMFS